MSLASFSRITTHLFLSSRQWTIPTSWFWFFTTSSWSNQIKSRLCTHHGKTASGNKAVLELKKNRVACIFFSNHDASFPSITTVHNSYILVLVKHRVILVQSNQSRPCTHHGKPASGNEAVLKLKENRIACISFSNHDSGQFLHLSFGSSPCRLGQIISNHDCAHITENPHQGTKPHGKHPSVIQAVQNDDQETCPTSSKGFFCCKRCPIFKKQRTTPLSFWMR